MGSFESARPASQQPEGYPKAEVRECPADYFWPIVRLNERTYRDVPGEAARRGAKGKRDALRAAKAFLATFERVKDMAPYVGTKCRVIDANRFLYDGTQEA